MPRENVQSGSFLYRSISVHSVTTQKIHNPSLTFILMKKASKRNDEGKKSESVHDEEGRQALILSISNFLYPQQWLEGNFLLAEISFFKMDS